MHDTCSEDTKKQIEATFEEAVTELEIAGIGKNQRELLLGYLQKIGRENAQEVQKDWRSWPDGEGGEGMRRVATWTEAHKVLVELESLRARNELLCTELGTAPRRCHRASKRTKPSRISVINPCGIRDMDPGTAPSDAPRKNASNNIFYIGFERM